MSLFSLPGQIDSHRRIERIPVTGRPVQIYSWQYFYHCNTPTSWRFHYNTLRLKILEKWKVKATLFHHAQIVVTRTIWPYRNENLWNTLLSILKDGDASPWAWNKKRMNCLIRLSSFFFRKLKYAYLHAHYHFVESQRFVQSTGAPYHTCSVCPGSEKFG